MTESFDYAKWRFYLEASLVFWNIALTFVLFIWRRQLATTARIDEMAEQVETRFDGVISRLDKVEVEVENTPNHDDLAKIYDRINQVAGETSRISGQLQGINSSLDRIQSFLLSRT